MPERIRHCNEQAWSQRVAAAAMDAAVHHFFGPLACGSGDPAGAGDGDGGAAGAAAGAEGAALMMECGGKELDDILGSHQSHA